MTLPTKLWPSFRNTWYAKQPEKKVDFGRGSCYSKPKVYLSLSLPRDPNINWVIHVGIFDKEISFHSLIAKQLITVINLSIYPKNGDIGHGLRKQENK